MVKKNFLFLALLFIGFYSMAQDSPADSLSKKTVKEFDFADTNKDGMITSGELKVVINEVFDKNTTYTSLDVYRLTLYLKGQYIPTELLGTQPAIVADAPADSSKREETSEEKPGFFDRYFSVGAELTGLYQYSGRLYKAKYDGPVSLPAKSHDEILTLFTIPVECNLWKGATFNITPEFSGGNGVGNGAGVAAYPGALFGFPGSRPYILRAQYQQSFERDTAKKSKWVSTNFVIGQFILQEMFSGNPYSGNPKRDFLNFAHTMLNAWDAATTAYGYTYGMAGSWVFKKGSLNAALVTVNEEAGGPKPDWNIKEGYSFNLQYARSFYS